jgi:hypothetical protein
MFARRLPKGIEQQDAIGGHADNQCDVSGPERSAAVDRSEPQKGRQAGCPDLPSRLRCNDVERESSQE